MLQPEQLDQDKTGRDGLTRWWVRYPHLSYDGRVLAPADWTRDQVYDALRELERQTSTEVLAGRLWSPTQIGPDGVVAG